ncbi:MAG: hypothetical protein ACHRHE_22355 [Tepidisphaerales bacterium]
MHPEIADFVTMPSRLTADVALLLIHMVAKKKRNMRLWTSSRLLRQLGVAWRAPEHHRLLHRVDDALRELASRGELRRRPRRQTSRNTRNEWAYELVNDPRVISPNRIEHGEHLR